MAATTAQQEDGSKWIFQRALKDDVNYINLTPRNQFVDAKTQEIIKSNWENMTMPKKKQKWEPYLNITLDKDYIELQKLFDPSYRAGSKKPDPVPKDWLQSYFAQQKALLEKYSGTNFKELKFYRDGGFMNYITAIIGQLGVAKKDAWNPADIWIIDIKKANHEDKLRKEITETVTMNGDYPTKPYERSVKIQELNALLRNYYRSNTIIGVSLKKTGKTAHYVDVNVASTEVTTKQEFDKIEKLVCEIKNIKCDLSIKTFKEIYGGKASEKAEKMKKELKKVGVDTTHYPPNPLTFGTQETVIEIFDKDHNKTYTLSIKATTTSHYSNLKYEPTEKGKGAAKLGKAPVDMVADLVEKYGVKFSNDNKKYPNKTDDVAKIKEIINRVKGLTNSAGIPVEKKEDSWDAIEKNIIEVFKSDPVTAQSKLMQLDFVCGILTLDKDKVQKMMTDIVYDAMKKGKKFGPFGKVY